jgi:hypothetical protein
MPKNRDDDYNDDDLRRIKKRDVAEDAVSTVIPYRNGPALASYYCGVFGLISCFLLMGFFGIVPIILGILGLRKAKQHPDAHGTAHAWTGIILGTIEVLSCVGVSGFFGYAFITDKRR